MLPPHRRSCRTGSFGFPARGSARARKFWRSSCLRFGARSLSLTQRIQALQQRDARVLQLPHCVCPKSLGTPKSCWGFENAGKKKPGTEEVTHSVFSGEADLRSMAFHDPQSGSMPCGWENTWVSLLQQPLPLSHPQKKEKAIKCNNPFPPPKKDDNKMQQPPPPKKTQKTSSYGSPPPKKREQLRIPTPLEIRTGTFQGDGEFPKPKPQDPQARSFWATWARRPMDALNDSDDSGLGF